MLPALLMLHYRHQIVFVVFSSSSKFPFLWTSRVSRCGLSPTVSSLKLGQAIMQYPLHLLIVSLHSSAALSISSIYCFELYTRSRFLWVTLPTHSQSSCDCTSVFFVAAEWSRYASAASFVVLDGFFRGQSGSVRVCHAQNSTSFIQDHRLLQTQAFDPVFFIAFDCLFNRLTPEITSSLTSLFHFCQLILELLVLTSLLLIGLHWDFLLPDHATTVVFHFVGRVHYLFAPMLPFSMLPSIVSFPTL